MKITFYWHLNPFFFNWIETDKKNALDGYCFGRTMLWTDIVFVVSTIPKGVLSHINEALKTKQEPTENTVHAGLYPESLSMSSGFCP